MKFAFAPWVLLALLVATRSLAAPPSVFVPFLERNCSDCHDSETKKGGLDLDALGTDLTDAATLAKWVRIHDRVRDGEMPPPNKGLLAATDKAGFLHPLSASLTKGHAQVKGTVMRRLNRAEYERTLNELLGTKVDVAAMLPEDGKSHGFDNVGEALDLSPTHLQRYLEAAGMALDASETFGPRPAAETKSYTLDAGRNKDHVGKHWLKRDDGALVVFTVGDYPAIKFEEFRASRSGNFQLRLTVAAHASTGPVTYGIYLGADNAERPVTLLDEFQAFPGAPQVLEQTVTLRRGDTLRIKPRLNNPYDALQKDPAAEHTPGLALYDLEVEGPVFDAWPSRGHLLRFGDLAAEDTGPMNQRNKSWYRPQYRLQSADPAADCAHILPPFVEAAFRRPVSSEMVQPYLALAQAELAGGAKLEQALRTAQTAVLCAPDFLYLIEPAGKLDDFALAARLSYMIWGTPPDSDLRTLASARKLQDSSVLRAQTERLLDDPRSLQFTRSFTGQWLNLRDIDFTVPDKQLYPEYDESLKHAMLRETELFFAEILRNNLSIRHFIDSDWTYANERLAQHYGLEGITGPVPRKVSLKPEHHRGGILTHASVLKVSANGTTTSPVVRGAYVLERILGIQPPPPPPGVPGVEPDIRGATTLRQLLEKHRSQESCNNCHRIIDPPGFALENYDVMGGWRANYRSLGRDLPKPPPEATAGRNVQWRIGPAVDASGQTPDGQPFTDLASYKTWLLSQPETFARALVEKVATYATGRPMGFSDRADIARLGSLAVAPDHGFRDVIHDIVQSELFTTK
jgi:hypothetical protein